MKKFANTSSGNANCFTNWQLPFFALGLYYASCQGKPGKTFTPLSIKCRHAPSALLPVSGNELREEWSERKVAGGKKTNFELFWKKRKGDSGVILPRWKKNLESIAVGLKREKKNEKRNLTENFAIFELRNLSIKRISLVQKRRFTVFNALKF